VKRPGCLGKQKSESLEGICQLRTILTDKRHYHSEMGELATWQEGAVAAIDARSNVGLPMLFTPTPAAARRTLEFFTAHIRNPNTRKAYAKATGGSAAWYSQIGLQELGRIEPVHVAAYVEQLQERLSPPSVKLNLAALPILFDWLAVDQVIPMNPASSVRGPRHSVRKGKTPVLTAEEARTLLDVIDMSTPIGLRDRALVH